MKLQKKTLIVSNGFLREVDFYRGLIKENDLVIAANGGCKHLLRLGIIPHLIIGDLDSLEEEIVSQFRGGKTKIISYPRDKDKSDTQLALEYALNHGASHINILGAIGDRIDHTLANLHLLTKGVDQGVDVRLIDEKNEVLLINKFIEIREKKGTTISLLPLTSCVKGIFTEGLKYPIKGGKMEIGNPYGISNEMDSSLAKIEIKSGYLLVIIVRE